MLETVDDETCEALWCALGPAEQCARRLSERAAKDDSRTVGGLLAAADLNDPLARELTRAADAAAGLKGRADRLHEIVRGAPDAGSARSGAARTERGARRLLEALRDLSAWLDTEPPAPPADADLATDAGRARTLRDLDGLRAALRAAAAAGPAARLSAVRDRLRRLERARDRAADALGRHLNNLLVHAGNEAAAAPPPTHHVRLLPYAPLVRRLRDLDRGKYDALLKLYTSTWARIYEREFQAACETARGRLVDSPDDAGDGPLDDLLAYVETVCNAEQDFCLRLFHLDAEERESGACDGSDSGSAGSEAARRAGPELRRALAEVLGALEPALLALVQALDRAGPLGAMRALAGLSRRVLAGEAGAGAAAGALAAAAVAAKRAADRAVAARAAAFPDAVRAAQRKPRAGLFSFLQEFEDLAASCERIFATTRRADLERWYLSLTDAMLRAIATAQHPRTPRAVVQMENYRRLEGVLATLRVPALDGLRREARARYSESLRAYVASSFGRPLEKLNQFFDGVAEAVAAGAAESEVCYRAAFSKQELRRVLALYPAAEVRRGLHRLYRSVEKTLSEEGGLLQVVWRAMQEEFIAQHRALQARVAACYPGAGLALPLDTDDILYAFSDIARNH